MWFQGESDAVDSAGAAYSAALEDLIGRVRAAADNPEMHVLIVGLADAPSPDVAAGYARIRGEQMTVAARDPLAVYVSAEGLPTAAPEQPHHLTAEGYRLLGARIAAVVR
jgi:lysophospholipase L1-like esterase